MKVRLVAQRLSEEDTEKRRRDINYRAKRKHTQASQARLQRHWVMLVVGWRCLRHSLSKTVDLITSYTRTITTNFRKSKKHLRQTFDEIKQVFETGCYIERRANRKTTLEYLENAIKKTLN